MHLRIFFIFIWAFMGSSALFAQSDTLSLTAFLQLVRDNHPVAQQANLLPTQAEARMRLAKGGFDPKLFGDADQKVFKGDNYYRHIDAGLKVMTLPGIEVKAGYEQANGINLNPEYTLPENGLMYAGVSVPLGQGLFIDGRRAAVRQAKIFRSSVPVQQLNILNDLFLSAAEAYWLWSLSEEVLAVQTEAVAIALTRFEAIRESYQFGDKAGVDTLEAFIQWQTRQQSLLEAQLAERQGRLLVSNFLWNEAGLPLEVTDELMPQALPTRVPEAGALLGQVEGWLQTLPEQHPALQILRFQLADLEVKRRLKADKLKPKVNVQYNLLNEPLLPGSDAELAQNIWENNFKWGLNVSFPILLREARGDLELTKLKIQETRLKQQDKQLELTNKVLAYLRELETLAEQVDLARETAENYAALLQAEIFKFEAGESSLFLINSRETKLIEAEIKLLQLSQKFRKAALGLEWSAGVLAIEE